MRSISIFNDIKNFIRKFSFKNPAVNEILIFDKEGSEIIIRMILPDYQLTILHARHEIYYLTSQILLLMIKNINKIDVSYLRKNKIHKMKRIFGELYKIYLLSCIEYIGPKVVLTYIDNSYFFQFSSRNYKKAKFFAIQNGVRNKYSVTKYLPEYPHPGHVVSMPNFFCFGENEKNLYEKHGHVIDNYIPCGSARGSYFISNLAPIEEKIIYDICLVSEWETTLFEDKMYEPITNSILIMHDYLKKYITENKISLCIATRSNTKKEKEYFENYFSSNIEMTDFNFNKMSTYHAMNKSRVVINFYSTAALEALGWGKKILFCNFSEDPVYDLPYDGMWCINEKNYEKFKSKLNSLREIDEAFYRQSIRKFSKYMMNYGEYSVMQFTFVVRCWRRYNEGSGESFANECHACPLQEYRLLSVISYN